MKSLLTLLICLFILSPNVAVSETMKDLVKRNGLHYKKFSDVPFTGKITGRIRGSFKNGEKHGPWVFYHDNGRLSEKGSYKKGKKEGLWIWFKKEGAVLGPFKGTYKNGEKIGD
mgnify:CR=1 FL=1